MMIAGKMRKGNEGAEEPCLLEALLSATQLGPIGHDDLAFQARLSQLARRQQRHCEVGVDKLVGGAGVRCESRPS